MRHRGFPGPVDLGGGTARAYIDSHAALTSSKASRRSARARGGMLGLFGTELVTDWLPSRVLPIEFEVSDGTGRVRIEGIGEAESELLSYPDGTIIRPWTELPHGIEFKRGLMTNTKRWWWRDDELLANYADKYGAIARVKFTQDGCVG